MSMWDEMFMKWKCDFVAETMGDIWDVFCWESVFLGDQLFFGESECWWSQSGNLKILRKFFKN